MSANVIHNLTLRRLGEVVTRDRPRADDCRNDPSPAVDAMPRPRALRRRRSVHASAHLRSLLAMAERRLADRSACLDLIADAIVMQQAAAAPAEEDRG